MWKMMKKYKYISLGIGLMSLLILLSFGQFFKENFSYVSVYYDVKEYCYEKKNPEHEYCKYYPTDEYLENYIENNDPKKVYKRYDAITLTCEIVENTIFNILQYFSPLLIAIMILGSVHSMFNSGMFENYLLKINYKKYLKNTYKLALKVSLITPIALFIIFFISSILTGFNFDYSNIDVRLSVYNEWKYDHFILYGCMICVIQYFISLLYSNLALYCCKKNKNMLVAIIMAFIMFLVVNIAIYVLLYSIILGNIFHLSGMSDYFNIAGYWFFDDISNHVLLIVLISFILQAISFIVLFLSYKDKEKVILSYEKQVS